MENAGNSRQKLVAFKISELGAKSRMAALCRPRVPLPTVS